MPVALINNLDIRESLQQRAIVGALDGPRIRIATPMANPSDYCCYKGTQVDRVTRSGRSRLPSFMASHTT